MIITNPNRNASICTPILFGFEEKLTLYRTFIGDAEATADSFVRFLRTNSADRKRFLSQFEHEAIFVESFYIEMYG